MLNEREEFRAYTTFPDYVAENKYDSTYLGRFTYAMLTKHTGLTRILTVLARGYMWQNAETPDTDRAYNALCAWCSIPDNNIVYPKKDWQDNTDFRRLHKAFPELVDVKGSGWFYRHVQNIICFSKDHRDKLSKKSLDSCAALEKGFDAAWRNKVLQYQVPLFTETTKGDWVLLPTVNFDAWFGTTAFARKWLSAILNEVLERSVSSYGVCRYRIRPEYLE